MSYYEGAAGDPGHVETPMAATSDERTWAMFCHLSGILAHWVYVGFLVPLIIWLLKKDQSKFVDYHGKEAVNFQLNLLGYGVIAVLFAIATCGVGLLLALPLMGVIWIYAIVMEIIAGIKANNGEYFRYPAIFRPIK